MAGRPTPTRAVQLPQAVHKWCNKVLPFSSVWLMGKLSPQSLSNSITMAQSPSSHSVRNCRNLLSLFRSIVAFLLIFSASFFNPDALINKFILANCKIGRADIFKANVSLTILRVLFDVSRAVYRSTYHLLPTCSRDHVG